MPSLGERGEKAMVKVGLASIDFSPDLHVLSHEILGIFKEPFPFL